MSQEFPNLLCSWNKTQSSWWRTFQSRPLTRDLVTCKWCHTAWSEKRTLEDVKWWLTSKALLRRALKFFVQVFLCYFLYSFTIKASWVLFRFSINSLSTLVMCDHTQRPTTTYIYSLWRFLCPTFRNTDICHTTEERKDVFSLAKRRLWETSEQLSS